MEKDIGKISKNSDTDIIIRVDDFGGKRGVTIREFVKGERYTGFTKAGTRIPAEKFKEFKALISEIDEKELMESLGTESSGEGMNKKFSGAKSSMGDSASESSVKKSKAKTQDNSEFEEEVM